MKTVEPRSGRHNHMNRILELPAHAVSVARPLWTRLEDAAEVETGWDEESARILTMYVSEF